MRDKRLKWALRLVLLWIILAAIGPCTITHKFGPYYGKVTDETGQPISGALVLIAFYSEMLTPGGTVSHFVNAVETSTDDDGAFYISPYRAWVFRFPQRWETDCGVTIFKPGYRAFPNQGGLVPPFTPYYSIPSNQLVTVKLPTLRTREDRIDNLLSLIPAKIPEEKLKSLRKLAEDERKEIGHIQNQNQGRPSK